MRMRLMAALALLMLATPAAAQSFALATPLGAPMSDYGVASDGRTAWIVGGTRCDATCEPNLNIYAVTPDNVDVIGTATRPFHQARVAYQPTPDAPGCTLGCLYVLGAPEPDLLAAQWHHIDVETGATEAGAWLDHPVSRPGIAAVNRDVAAISGGGCRTFCSVTQTYDVDLGHVTVSPNRAQALIAPAVAYDGTHVYIAGGGRFWHEGPRPLMSVETAIWRYSPDRPSDWMRVGALPEGRYGMHAVATEAGVLFLGGNDGAGPRTDAYLFDGQEVWNTAIELPEPIHEAVVLSGEVYVFGKDAVWRAESAARTTTLVGAPAEPAIVPVPYVMPWYIPIADEAYHERSVHPLEMLSISMLFLLPAAVCAAVVFIAKRT